MLYFRIFCQLASKLAVLSDKERITDVPSATLAPSPAFPIHVFWIVYGRIDAFKILELCLLDI